MGFDVEETVESIGVIRLTAFPPTGWKRTHATSDPMTEPHHHPDAEPTLFVCQACGVGIESTEILRKCPECGGIVRNTTVPHD